MLKGASGCAWTRPVMLGDEASDLLAHQNQAFRDDHKIRNSHQSRKHKGLASGWRYLFCSGEGADRQGGGAGRN